MQANWKVESDQDLSKKKQMTTTKGFFTGCLSYLFNQAGDFLYKLGIFGAMEGAVSRYCIGYATLHPGYFMSAILASALVKMQAEQI